MTVPFPDPPGEPETTTVPPGFVEDPAGHKFPEVVLETISPFEF